MFTSHWLNAIRAWLGSNKSQSVLHSVQMGATKGVNVVLDPQQAQDGARVSIPVDAVIYDGEPVWLQWAEQGSAGSYRTDQQIPPLVPGTRDFKVPVEKIRWHIGRELKVHYEVYEPNVARPHASSELPVNVARLSGLPDLQSTAIVSDEISLARLGGAPAVFTLDPWPLMATDQFVTVDLTGNALAGGTLTISVADKRPVPAAGVRMTVGNITSQNLRRFVIGERLDIEVGVSFDGNLSQQAFPRVRPKLVT